MELLRIEHVTKSFGGLSAVGGVSLRMENGELLGLIGPNGAGKTTLFNLVSGELRPDGGRVLLKGEDVTGAPMHEMASRGVIRTFQEVKLFKSMTVWENLMVAYHLRATTGFWGTLVGGRSTHLDKTRMEAAVVGILTSVGLIEARDQRVPDLSHGHQRLLSLAIALASEPELILLDEPVAGMNQSEIEVMLNIIKSANDKGFSFLVVEHNMSVMMGLCPRIIVMEAGKKIAEGSPASISADERVIKAYLGSVGLGVPSLAPKP